MCSEKMALCRTTQSDTKGRSPGVVCSGLVHLFFMRLVIIESPYAGDIPANVEYARAAVRDSLSRGEAPIASHLLYTQPGILRDELPDERQWGIDAGLAWRHVSEATVVYTDRGMSRGMEYGIAAARAAGKPVEFRSLKVNAQAEPHP